MFELQYILSGLVLFVMLTVLVAAHEWGHYLFARMFGMKVDAFALMIGGVRKTDLGPYLAKPLAPGWIVAAVWAALLAAWNLMASMGPSLVLYAVQIGAVLVVPLWIATRLAALYHTDFANLAKWFVIGWVGWFFALRTFGALEKVGAAAMIPMLLPVSLVALLIAYYIPVFKREEEEEYGHGQIRAAGQVVPVRYRPVWSTTRGGTEFSLLLLPLGGFAKIRGMQPKEDGSEVLVEGGFFSKPPWKRLLVLFAGPLFSVLAGMAIFFGIFATYGSSELDDRPLVGKTMPGSPAALAGLKEGDLILSIDGKKFSTFWEMRQYVALKPLREVSIVYRRGVDERRAELTTAASTKPEPVLDAKGKETGTLAVQGKLGIVPGVIRKPMTVAEAATEAVSIPWKWVGALADRVGKPAQLKDEVGGIASIAAVTDAAAREGLGDGA